MCESAAKVGFGGSQWVCESGAKVAVYWQHVARVARRLDLLRKFGISESYLPPVYCIGAGIRYSLYCIYYIL